MSEFTELKDEVEELKRELAEFKRARFQDLSANETEDLKGVIFERTAATLASGASLSRYAIVSLNGERGAIAMYNKFTPLA